MMRILLSGTACLAAASIAMAQAVVPPPTFELSLTGQPREYDIQMEPYVVRAFGRARFGMTVEEVKAVIAGDFPAALAGAKDVVDPVERTRSLTVVVPQLPPAPAPATISYVFGHATQKLIATNVSWQFDGDPAAAQRQQLLAAGTRLAADLVGHQWPPLASGRGRVTGPGVLVLFTGRDEAGGGVELRLDGVALDVERPSPPGAAPLPPVHRPAPAGPARLRLSLVANALQPDIYRVPAGRF